MKTTQFEDTIVSVFQDYPSLCGFSVQRSPGLPDGGAEALRPDLYLTDVGLYPQPGLDDTKLICRGVRDVLVRLIEERPEASRLLAGRTFARALH